MISIFTPAYNRKYTLPTLYESLKNQSNSDFEWIVVDDGSTDGTSNWLAEVQADTTRKFQFFYCVKENGGKHCAINKGIEMASGELFVIIDSDDTVSKDAVQVITENWEKYGRNKKGLLGMCLRRGDPDSGTMLGKPFKKVPSYATPQKIAYGWNMTCDKAEIFKTEVIKQHPFPIIDGEKFCTEIVWVFETTRQMNGRGYMLCMNNIIRFTKYMPDGLTMNAAKIRKENPKGYIRSYQLQLLSPWFWLHPKVVLRTFMKLIVTSLSVKRGICKR